MVEVKAGQWWTEKGYTDKCHRLVVLGFTSKGDVVCEWNGSNASSLRLEYFLKFKERLPDCTSFEWVPEVYPQYRETYIPNVWAFVRLDSPSRYTYVRLDGKEDAQQLYGPAHHHISERTMLTEAEALARIVKPEPKYPIYWTTMNPDEYAYLEQVDAENVRAVKKDGTPNRPGKASHHEFLSRTRLTEEQAEALIQKPKPKTRTVKVHTVEMSDRPQDRFVSVGVNDEGLAKMRKNWRTVHVLKTEEFEVPVE